MLGFDCWYCDKGEPAGPLIFSREFDTPIHLQCVKDALSKDPQCPEARIIGREFDLELEPEVPQPEPTWTEPEKSNEFTDEPIF